MDRKTTLRNLRACQKWLEKQTHKNPAQENGGQAQNIMIACFQCLHYSCLWKQEQRNAWIERNKARRTLRNIQRTFCRPAGRKILGKLLTLTISAIGATTWTDDFCIDALPIDREPEPVSQQKREHMRRAAEARWRHYRELRERVLARSR